MVVKQSTLSIAAGAIFLALAVLLGGGVFLISSSINQQQQAVERQAESRQLGVDLMNAANLMSDAARKFVLTADPANFNAYWKEVNETRTRERVASRLSELDTPQEELDLLADSQKKTEPLTDSELRAMRLTLESRGTFATSSTMPPALANYKLRSIEAGMKPEEKIERARGVMADQQYEKDRQAMLAPIAAFQEKMNARLDAEVQAAQARTSTAVKILFVVAAIMPLGVGAILWLLHSALGRPVAQYVAALRRRSEHADEAFTLTPQGTSELRQLADAFNAELGKNEEQLRENRDLVEGLTDLVADVARNAESLGDMSARLEETARGTNLIVPQVTSAMQGVAGGAQETSQASLISSAAIDQLSGAVDSIAEGASAQEHQVQTATSTASEMAAGVEEVASNAQRVAATSQQTRVSAERGAQAVRETVDSIHAITGVVSDAAGKVEELGKLGDKIGAVRALDEILSAVDATVADVTGIASSAQQMAAGARGVVDAMEGMREAIEQSTGATREISLQAGEVTAATQSIAAIAEENSAATEQVLASTEDMGSQIDGVTAQAEELARTAEQLRNLVERFHATTGTDAEYDDDEYADDEEPVVARRRGGDWTTADHRGEYAHRAS